METILSKEGYLIPKTNKTIINQIKDELTVEPISTCNFKQKLEKFPVYSENNQYLSIPKYYGIEKFGKPSINKELNGKEMKIEFKSELRPKQIEILNTVIPYLEKNDGGVLCLPCGYGKCLAYNTKILMYDGTIKYVQDVIIGDYLMGDDSDPRRVESLGRGKELMYTIIDIDNPSVKYTVNKSHILSLYDIYDNVIVDINTEEFYNNQNKYKHLHGVRAIVDFNEKETLTSPYVYGRNINLTRDYYISYEYKINSIDNRKQLLHGILDKHAYVHKNYYELEVYNLSLLDDIIFIINSIGYGIVNKTDTLIHIYIPKQYSEFYNNKYTVYSIKIHPVDEQKYYGFEIFGNNRRFLLGDCTITHNTILSLYIASHFNVKTLVIVHKTFLLNQWKDRTKEFTSANIGIIQRDNIDIKDKHIVIGMLQSIAKDKYDPDIFKDFGLVIFDEAHHAPSKYFSRALPIISCKKTLALSATPKRSDRLEKILYWYFGKIMYKLENSTNENVIVNIYNYKIEHEKFREFFLKSGDINRTKTINKITTIGRRNKFIIDILYKLLQDNNSRKVIVLSDRVDHLKALKKRLDSTITSSFYIGGMKQSALDKSELSQVIFATYSMAAEALDIPTLNTLFMVTPRREIEQAVGRILRKIDINNRPIIYDFVDELPTFMNQGKYRKQYYNKMKFEQHIYNGTNHVEEEIIEENIIDFID